MQLPAAAQILVAIVPIVGIVMGFLLVFFYLLWSHREKVRLIERGLYQAGRIDLEAFCLLAGLVLCSIGLILTILFAVLEGLTFSILGGLIPLAVGASFLAFFGMRRNRKES